MRFKKVEKERVRAHHWVSVTNRPWLKTFGGYAVLHCSICGRFINVPKEDVEKLEAKTRSLY